MNHNTSIHTHQPNLMHFSQAVALLILILVLLGFSSCTSNKSAADWVNPFIGTDGHGHTFPGATLPFGMVQLSPDTRKDSWDGCSGYHYSDRLILGFSHTHLSGTGVGDYGDIRMMPALGELRLRAGDKETPGYHSAFLHENEKATPGYYSVKLDDYQIIAELTASERAGFHRYSFPASNEAHILIDLFESVTSEKILDSEIQIVNDTVITGFRRTKGWANDQHCYFYAVFSKPFQSFGIQDEGKVLKQARTAKGTDLVAWAGFETTENEKILVKVGLSAVDPQGAKNNVLNEIPDWNFEKVKQSAEQSWNNELSKIDIKTNDTKEKVKFYTAVYHSMIAPNMWSDADGRYRGHDNNIHKDTVHNQYTVFSLWDTFRALHPLFNLIDKKRSADFVQSMLIVEEQGGLLPVWELAANETWCMIGYHAVPVIADAIALDIKGFDRTKALDAMVKSASQTQFGLDFYRSEGYIPADQESESVSKTLEYAYDDWCIGETARRLGKDSLAKVFFLRSENYKNLYDPQTHFFRGRQNGGFLSPFDPAQVNFMLTEANSWQYNFFVPHDIMGHIRLMGGAEVYGNMLDSLFWAKTQLTGRQQADITGLIGQYAHGNEPSHHMAYLYNYIGQPAKTQELVNRIIDEMYSDQPDGLCGNEDCGQMSAWYVMSALGFYPVTPGTGIYSIGSPRFDEARIKLDEEKVFTIKTKNRDKTNAFIAAIELNNKPLNRSYLKAEDIVNGGEMLVRYDEKPSVSFGIGDENIPVQKLQESRLVAVPWISAASKTFSDSLRIAMGHPDPEVIITYTLNKKEPLLTSTHYTKPFLIDQSTQIIARAFKFDGPSRTVVSDFYRIAGGKTVSLVYPYNPQYHAGGDVALIDHQFGSNDFRTGAWQGFYGEDMIATVDLGSLQPVKKIKTGFLQDQKSWIFMPEKVEYWVSTDGNIFTSVAIVNNTVSNHAEGGVVKRFSAVFPQQLIRYIKVVAVNPAVCPDWHPGTGEACWIFSDEIEIQ